MIAAVLVAPAKMSLLLSALWQLTSAWAMPAGRLPSAKPTGFCTVVRVSETVWVPDHIFHSSVPLVSLEEMMKRRAASSRRLVPTARPVSAAPVARMTWMCVAAVRRLPFDAIAIATPRLPKRTRNIIARMATTPRLSRRLRLVDRLAGRLVVMWAVLGSLRGQELLRKQVGNLLHAGNRV